MPRAKKTETPVVEKVSADDFLAELEATEDALSLDEDDEIVSEEDILAELGEAPAAARAVPDPEPKDDTLAVVTSLLCEQEGKVRDIVSGAESRIQDRQEVLAKAVGEVLKQVIALGQAVKELAAAKSAPPAPAKASAETFVNAKPAAKAGPVESYMLKEIHQIVAGLPAGFDCEVSRLSKVIHSKRFAGDPSALPKIEAMCREHLGEFGTIKNGVFTRFANEADITL